jgi:hypothetical protein
MDRTRHDIPATYYGRPDTIEYGDQMLLAARYYNNAWASPEMNSIGLAVLNVFVKAEYQYIYSREKREEEHVREDTKKYGWRTTTLTRKAMVADLQSVVRQNELFVYDIRIIDEMRVFVWTKQGKAQAETGEHDDCVIMLAGLLQLHQRCPYNEDLTFDQEHDTEKADMAVAGYVPQDVDFDDEDGLEALYDDGVEELG